MSIVLHHTDFEQKSVEYIISPTSWEKPRTNAEGWDAFANSYWNNTAAPLDPNTMLEVEAVAIADRFLPRTRGKLLIREEMVRAYERIAEALPTSDRGAVLCGQPGIGKSASILYFVARQLIEHRIVMVLLEVELFLFTGQGVLVPRRHRHEVTVDDLPSLGELVSDRGMSKDPYWLIVDVDDDSPPPPSALVNSSLLSPVYMAESPYARHFRGMQKARGAHILYMNPWTEKELLIGLGLQTFYAIASPPRQARYKELLPEFIRKFGHAARDVFLAMKGEDEERHIEEVLNSLTSLRHLRVLCGQASTNLTILSHKLVMIRRRDRKKPSVIRDDDAIATIKSAFIEILVYKWAREVTLYNATNFLDLLSGISEPSTLAGRIFEATALRTIAGETSERTAPLMKMEREAQRRAWFFHKPAGATRALIVQYAEEDEDDLEEDEAEELEGDLDMDLRSGPGRNDESAAPGTSYRPRVDSDDVSPPNKTSLPPILTPQASAGPTMNIFGGVMTFPNLAGRIVFYKNLDRVNVYSGKLHAPHSIRNSLFDAFFVDHHSPTTTLWICQMAMAKTHEGARSGYGLIARLRDKLRSKFGNVEVKYLLVVPNDSSIEWRWHLPVGWAKSGVRGDVYCVRLPGRAYGEMGQVLSA
ncbi:hypothetical protein FA95DRAFT_1679301 [Auriscalpium vulgare]|uniref:Uncharacterized protein n=1 Tax=Auriscalpium vulgare TaxID=40419 RepID=A0ACB8RU87_9AGAM|nr:hypothetical protein FA95DRAFT_1679301 [Auriscalpium vulgare]